MRLSQSREDEAGTIFVIKPCISGRVPPGATNRTPLGSHSDNRLLLGPASGAEVDRMRNRNSARRQTALSRHPIEARRGINAAC